MTKQEALEMIQGFPQIEYSVTEWVECLKVCAEALKKAMREDEKKGEVYKVCPVCGKTFLRTKNSKKFCSAECREAAAKKRREENSEQTKDRVFKCWGCGKLFKSDRKKKFCTEECRLEASGKKGKKKPQSLTEICKLANEAGLTYGQYMSKRGYE